MKRVQKINVLADALQVSVFCKLWWEKLVIKCNSYHQSKEQKIMIFTKIARGLYDESLKLCDNIDDFNHIKLELDKIFFLWNDYPRNYE